MTVDNDEISTLNTESASSADAPLKNQRKKPTKKPNAERESGTKPNDSAEE